MRLRWSGTDHNRADAPPPLPYNREREEPNRGAARKYAVIEPATGKIDRAIFSEQAIYDDEMEKIFACAWRMIRHESLVPATADFFHTYTRQ